MILRDEDRDGSRVCEPFEVHTPNGAGRNEPSCLHTLLIVSIYSLGSVGLNLLMKFLFSHIQLRISGEIQVYGLPAPLFWTATQQAIGFGCFAASLLLYRYSKGRYGYRPPPLGVSTAKQVALLALSFAASMGLNNLSLALVSLSVNNMIRSTSPLTTAIAAAIWTGWTGNAPSSEQWTLVVLGTVFVLVNVLASRPAPSPSMQDSSFTLGVAAGFLSTLGGAFMFIIVELFKGSPSSLNATDSMGYMSLPAAFLLAPWIFMFPHATGNTGNWESLNRTDFTDLELVGMVSDRGKLSAAVAVGGCAAYAYNILQFYTVQELSSTQTAFASNVSKAVLVLISWMFLEPSIQSVLQYWLVLLSAAGGLVCFFLYALSKVRKSAPGELWYHDRRRAFLLLFLALAAMVLGSLAGGFRHAEDTVGYGGQKQTSSA